MTELLRADFTDSALIDGMLASMTYDEMTGEYGHQIVIDPNEYLVSDYEAEVFTANLADYFDALSMGREATATEQAAYDLYSDQEF